jgi:hypothetical protein
MEAHQNFTTPLDLTYCGKIELAVRNGDTDSRPVLLELILTDSSESRLPLSLGRVAVRTESREQILSYPVPEFRPIQRFDEAIIRFHLDSARQTQSARIAIRYLLLVPRVE